MENIYIAGVILAMSFIALCFYIVYFFYYYFVLTIKELNLKDDIDETLCIVNKYNEQKEC